MTGDYTSEWSSRWTAPRESLSPLAFPANENVRMRNVETQLVSWHENIVAVGPINEPSAYW